MFATHDSYTLAMDLSEDEQDLYYSIYNHSFAALDREGLVNRGQMLDHQFLREALGTSPSYDIPADGFVYKPTVLVEELLLWGLERGDLDTALVPNQEGRTDLELFEGLDLSVADVATVTAFLRLEQLILRRKNDLHRNIGRGESSFFDELPDADNVQLMIDDGRTQERSY